MFTYYMASGLYALLIAYKSLYWWAPMLAGFAILLGLDALKREKTVWSIIWAGACAPGLVSVLLHFVIPVGVSFLNRKVELPGWHLYLASAEFVSGLILGMWWLRKGVQKLEKIKANASVKTALERDKKTDIRNIDTILPPELGKYDPTRYFKLSRGVFAGLDRDKRPIYIDPVMLDEIHLMLCGRTRSGKGVIAQILGVQSIQRDELFVVLDPKGDNWMPHIFEAECKRLDKPYVFLDLRAGPQINPFEDADENEIEDLLLAAFSLSERGEAADFYRVGDRRAALDCARLIVRMRAQNRRTPTAADIMATEIASNWQENATNFWGYMMEMAELQAVNAHQGISLKLLEQTGGCLYILGDMQNSRVVRMQRLFLLRLMQMARKRITLDGPAPRLIRVFADEFTVHISRPFMVSLAASAQWRLCVILAFQTLGDLADCPADLNADSVKAKVWENCAVKLMYAVRDSDTAEWLAANTGIIQVDDESRRVEKNLALSEQMDGDRTLRQSESNLIDLNMLLGLPKGCGVLFGATKLPVFCYTSPVTVKRTLAGITPTHLDKKHQISVPKSLAATLVDLDTQDQPDSAANLVALD